MTKHDALNVCVYVLQAVQQVITNLLIAHIELRTEDSIDIQQYSFERKIEKIVVPMGDELNRVKTQYVRVLESVTQRLRQHGVLFCSDLSKLTKFIVLKSRDAFRQNPPVSLQVCYLRSCN